MTGVQTCALPICLPNVIGSALCLLDFIAKDKGVNLLKHIDLTPDPELKAVCIDQAKEIYRLKMRLAELEGEKKLA